MTMKSLEKHPPKRLSLWFTVSSLPTFYFRPLSFHPSSLPRFPFPRLSDRLILSCVSSRSPFFFIGRLPRTRTSSTRPRKTFLLSRRVKTGARAYVHVLRTYCTRTSHPWYNTLHVLPELCPRDICNPRSRKDERAILSIYISTKGCVKVKF